MKLSEKLAPYLENQDLEELINLENVFLDLMKKQDNWIREYPELKRLSDKYYEISEENEILKKALAVTLKGY